MWRVLEKLQELVEQLLTYACTWVPELGCHFIALYLMFRAFRPRNNGPGDVEMGGYLVHGAIAVPPPLEGADAPNGGGGPDGAFCSAVIPDLS